MISCIVRRRFTFFSFSGILTDGAITATDGVTELFQGRISVNEK
jgi:hypothetical protein